MTPEKIRFIVNPFSGVGKKGELPEILRSFFEGKPQKWELRYTEEPGHATELAKEAVDNGFDLVVAIGGDGSVNEVMSGLLKSDTKLGVLPAGSGNGFGRHIGMSLNTVTALEQLLNGKAHLVDTCLLNDRSYLNLAGVGFDAQVATRLHASQFRGFWAYLKFSLEEAYRYGSQRYEIEVDGEQIEEEFLMIEVANAPMFGFNFEVASKARIDDGLLEVVFVEAVPKWRVALAVWRLLTKSFHHAPFVRRRKARKITIRALRQMPVHVDGESFYMEGELVFSVVPKSLWVLLPQK